jgi:hypothetical protein
VLVDPLPIAASSPNPAYNFYVIKSDGYGSERRDTTTGLILQIKHDRGTKNDRHYVNLSLTKDATNPYIGVVSKQTITASIAVNVPSFGYTETEAVNHIKALLDTLSDADFSTTKLLQFQS